MPVYPFTSAFQIPAVTLIACSDRQGEAPQRQELFKYYGIPPSSLPVICDKDLWHAVLMEDSAAVAGVFLATASILLTHFTGNVVYDAVGSNTIGGT